MCCDGTGYSRSEIDGECPDCGSETVEGDAYEQCGFSPTECETCGSAPCDQSC